MVTSCMLRMVGWKMLQQQQVCVRRLLTPSLHRLCCLSSTAYGLAQPKTNQVNQTAPKQILLRSNMNLKQLANEIKVDPDAMVVKLQEIDASSKFGLDTILSQDLLELILMEYDIDYDEISLDTTSSRQDINDATNVTSRPPVVTIMGHIDHGKTTLLDMLRQTSVAANEAGGITQHIGAFSVNLANGKQITFLDTPGHAAFASMRARGANVTDVVVLVIAADEGIMPQTQESIRYAKLAGVPIIVAINKIDRKNANVNYVKQGCLKMDLQLEEFGGDIQAVEVSALKGTNLDNLTEAILLHGEMANLRADPAASVKGIVIESKIDKGLGAISTVLVQRGTLRKGHILVSGNAFAKVRVLLDDAGRQLKEATPSCPVQVTGWRNLPEVGDDVVQTNSENTARELIAARSQILKRRKEETNAYIVKQRSLLIDNAKKSMKSDSKIINTEMEDACGVPKLAIVVKGDVAGSIEAVREALEKFQSDDIKLELLKAEVGPIMEKDVELASCFKGIVFGFNVKSSNSSRRLAKQFEVPIHTSNVIYKLLEIVKSELSARLPLGTEEEVKGEAEILQTFSISLGRNRTVQVAGCRIVDGHLLKNGNFRVFRNGSVIYEGPAESLKHIKKDVDVIRKGQECGISFGNACAVEENDKIMCFTAKKVRRSINWDFF